MPDAVAILRWNESQDIQSAEVAPTSGTEDLQTATVTLRNTFGAVVGVPPVQNVTLDNTPEVGGFVTDPDVAPFAWYRLNPAALGLPDPGLGQTNYLLEFTLTDSAGEEFVSEILVVVKGSGADTGAPIVIAPGATAVTSVAGKTGDVTLTEADVLNLVTHLAATEKTANKGIANGYASLDAGGLVPVAQLPAGTGGGTGLPAGMVYDPAILTNGTDMAAQLTASLAALGAAGGGWLLLPRGVVTCNSAVTWPTNSNVCLCGQGMSATTIDFAASTTGGFVYSAATRISYTAIRRVSVHGPATGTGIDFADTDILTLEECRVYNWATCVKITSTATRGALRNRLLNCILTNGVTNGLWLTGAQGPHETYIEGGQLSICGTGLRIDSPTDDCRVFGTQLESNTQAILQAGVRGYFNCRFEGNTADCAFAATAAYNVLQTAFFERTKHSDVSTGAGIGTNRVLPWGFSTSGTERLAPLYIPCDPMSVPLTSQVLGNLSAVSHLFHVHDLRKVTTLTIVPSVQSGNVDIAITDAGGVILGSTGSTVVGAVNVKQDIPLTTPIYIGPGRDYYVSVMFDNGTAALYGILSAAPGFQLMLNEGGGKVKTLTFPFASQNPISGASGSFVVPAVRLG